MLGYEPETSEEAEDVAEVIDLTESTFDSEVANGVTLVDFWAPWCGPCKLMHPILDAVAGKVAGRARVARLNVDENMGLANRFGVQSIPTIVILKDGQEVGRHEGVTEERTLLAKVQPIL